MCENKLTPQHLIPNENLTNGVRLRKHNQYDLKMMPFLLPFLFQPGKEKNRDTATKCFWSEVCRVHLFSYCPFVSFSARLFDNRFL